MERNSALAAKTSAERSADDGRDSLQKTGLKESAKHNGCPAESECGALRDRQHPQQTLIKTTRAAERRRSRSAGEGLPAPKDGSATGPMRDRHRAGQLRSSRLRRSGFRALQATQAVPNSGRRLLNSCSRLVPARKTEAAIWGGSGLLFPARVFF